MVCGLVYHRKIRPTQLWVELSWVVANMGGNKISPSDFPRSGSKAVDIEEREREKKKSKSQ